MDAVVVSHESAEDLEGLLDCDPLMSAFRRIVVADNASSDDSVRIAERAGVNVVRHDRNAGFGAAANSGIKHTDSPIVALLNPDIRAYDDSLGLRLQERFVSPRIGLVAPTLILPDGSKQDSAREVPTPLDITFRRYSNPQRGAVWAVKPTAVPWVVGACMAIRRRAFEEVGGFDERFFMYFEDVDLCVRLKGAGWDVMLDSETSVEHHHAASSRRSLTGWSTRQHIRSAMRFYRKHPRHLLHRTV
jgi:N-acetylglucosaminyl-diphospho-decaprenol L-rhamnosyltransferase